MIIGAVGIALMVIGMIIGNMMDSVIRTLLDEVNQKLPDDRKMTRFWVHGKLPVDVLNTHRFMFPLSDKRRRFVILAVGGALVFLAGSSMFLYSLANMAK